MPGICDVWGVLKLGDVIWSVTITTFVGQCIVLEIIVINVVMLAPFYAICNDNLRA